MSTARKSIVKLVQQWVASKLSAPREELLQIELNSHSKFAPFSMKQLTSELQCHSKSLDKNKDQVLSSLNVLKDYLVDEDIIKPGLDAFQLNQINKYKLALLKIKQDPSLLVPENLVHRKRINKHWIQKHLGTGFVHVSVNFPEIVTYIDEEFEPEIFRMLSEADLYDRDTFKSVSDIKIEKAAINKKNKDAVIKKIRAFTTSMLDGGFDSIVTLPYQTTDNKRGTQLNYSQIASLIENVTYTQLYRYRDLLNPITEKSIEYGIINPTYTSTENESIRRIKVLESKLSKNPTLLEDPSLRYGATLAYRGFVRLFPNQLVSIQTLKKQKRVHLYWTDTFTPFVHSLMKKHCIFDISSYKTYKERVIERNSKPQEGVTGQDIRDAYKNKLLSVNDFDSSNFKLAVIQLFSLCVIRENQVSMAQSYAQKFLEYAKDNLTPDNTSLITFLDPFIAVRIKKWCEDKIASEIYSPSTMNAVIHAIQRALEHYSSLDGFDLNHPFVKVSGFDTSGRTTDLYKPYTKEARILIAKVIDEECARITSFHSQKYVKSNSTKTFIGDHDNGHKNAIIASLVNETTLKNYFDLYLNSTPVFAAEAKACKRSDPRHIFYTAFKTYRRYNRQGFQDLQDMYDSWGVKRHIQLHEIVPFYIRLLQVTGMNPESCATLDKAAFLHSHPATGKPCLRYFKERSTGDKEMLLDLFTCNIQWLSKKQSDAVHEIVEKVIQLTEGLREAYDEELNRDLFIYETYPATDEGGKLEGLANTYPRAGSVTRDSSHCNLTKKLVTENNEEIQITPTRFRPSMVSELVDQEVSLKEIQLMLGHASITTTIKYLETLDLNKIARTRVAAKLNDVYENAITIEKEDTGDIEHQVGEIVFKTALGGCKNIMSPPEYIIKSTNYKGGACNNFNKCLLCDNVIITRNHLPELLAQQRDLLHVVTTGIERTPIWEEVTKKLQILNQMLGENSEFSEEELNEARRLSMYVDSTIIINGGS